MISDTEAERERMTDAAVMRRLATDPAYLNADNAEEQAEREEQIAREVEADLSDRRGPTQ